MMNLQGLGKENRRPWRIALAVIAMFALAPSLWAQNGPYTTAFEISTAKQTVRILLPAGEENRLLVHIDQFESDTVNGVAVPKGFVSAGNLQIFEGSKKTEKTDFSDTPMIIYLGNGPATNRPVSTFAIFRKEGEKGGHWVYWDSKGDNEELKAMGFDGDFHPGEKAFLVVRKWPAGDPTTCH